MTSFVRFVVFVAVTLAAIVGSHITVWILLNPFYGIIVPLIALPWVYRLLRKHLPRKSAAPAQSALIPAEVLWTIIAFAAIIGGNIGGFMAWNPDGPMPRPKGQPWELIRYGSFAGAVCGLGLVLLLLIVNWALQRSRQAA